MTAATFNDINEALKLNGQQAKVTITKNGKYNNIDKGGIQPFAEEESVGASAQKPVGNTQQQLPPAPSTKTPESMERVKSYQSADERRQSLIIRQNSWTQANNLLANMLKALELGLLTKEQVVVTKGSLEKVAHEIEADIMRE